MKTIKEFVQMTVATLIISSAVFFFLYPSHASVSSISGLSIVLSNFIPFSIATITMALNILLLIVGFLLIGNEFGAKTIYTSLLLPAFLKMYEILFPNFQSLTHDPILDVAAYIFIVSLRLIYIL